jgi:hypothetical protein
MSTYPLQRLQGGEWAPRAHRWWRLPWSCEVRWLAILGIPSEVNSTCSEEVTMLHQSSGNRARADSLVRLGDETIRIRQEGRHVADLSHVSAPPALAHQIPANLVSSGRIVTIYSSSRISACVACYVCSNMPNCHSRLHFLSHTTTPTAPVNPRARCSAITPRPP